MTSSSANGPSVTKDRGPASRRDSTRVAWTRRVSFVRAWFAVAVCVLLAGCGRIRYEERACPQGTAEIAGEDGGTPYCIDVTQDETPMTYVAAVDHCAGLDMRLCTDAEWLTACSTNSSLDRMTDDWEWVADLVDETTARKRGGGGCELMSQHDTSSDAYSVRCCRDR
jgi:hypothetical protein